MYKLQSCDTSFSSNGGNILKYLGRIIKKDLPSNLSMELSLIHI